MRNGTITVPPPTPKSALKAPATVPITASFARREPDMVGDTRRPASMAISPDFPELEPFVAEPQRSALLFDIDGTLAPIVADPAASAVSESTRQLLEALDRRYALVAC